MDDEMPCQWNSHRGGMCFNAAVNGRIYCQEHLEYRRQYMKAFRARQRGPEQPKPDYPRCNACTGQAAEGKKYCLLHLKIRRKYMKQYREKHRDHKDIMASRICQECQVEKDAVAFYLPKMTDRKFYWTICKDCMKQKIREGIRNRDGLLISRSMD